MKYATTILVFCVAALLSLGLVMLYSSSMSQSGATYPVAQVIWCGLGLLAAGGVACVDYRHLKKISLPLFLLAIALLVLVLVPSSGIVLLVAGVRWRYFFPPLILGAITFVLFLLNNPVRMKRIFSWINPDETKEGVGYQAWQAMLALGSGGWSGLGLGNGRQKFGFLPEHQTDLIFANIGEELGLIATLSVVAAFVMLLICGVYIAWHARDTFGLLLGTGLTFLIGLQAFINVGVVTSALPNKGLPLPFISRGGSNLFLMLVCVGLLLSVARRAADPRTPAPKSPDLEETAIPRAA